MPELRPDRLATLYLLHPLTLLTMRHTRRLPILMYHSISAGCHAKRHPYYETVTTPAVFEAHMKVLRDNAYRAITLGEAVSLLLHPVVDDVKRVVITFDDGFQDFYKHGWPIMSKYGYSPTMFLPTAFISNTARTFNGTSCLTWPQVRELASAGVHFGSHTVTHSRLRDLSPQKVRDELIHSKSHIEDMLGHPIQSFAYPYAFPEADRLFRRALRETLQETGYKNGVSTVIGRASFEDDYFFLKRLPMNSLDDLALFKAKLEGSYDWMHVAQYAFKLAPRWLKLTTAS